MPNIAQTPKNPSRADKMYSQGRIDPYERKKKLPDPTRCPRCGALYIQGRWTWQIAGQSVNEELCPACLRINDKVPAGVLHLSGVFFEEHREEIENLINNQEKLEKERHPLERLMGMRYEDNKLRVETTGIHVARRIGDALNNAYQGKLDLEYLQGQRKVRVSWER
jgi:hypothetical protein